MLHRFKINPAFFLAKQIHKVVNAQKGVLVMGGLITPIARALGIDSIGLEQPRGSCRLNLESCITMKMIARESNCYCLLFRDTNFTLPLPNQRRTIVHNSENWRIKPTKDEEDDEATPMDPAPPPPSERSF